MTKAQIKKLDIQWSLAVRERDGKCMKCGRRDGLQGAHIFSRRSRSVRWDLDNGIALCMACHLFWAHQEPVEFTRFLEGLLGRGFLKKLERKKNTIIKYQEIVAQKD